MSATRTLREEHRLILEVLGRFEPALCAARQTGTIDPAVFEPFLEFFRGFADHCHHGKEEHRLFPCLQRCGMPGDCGPIAVMLEEHRQGRFHVRSMAELLPAAPTADAAAVDAFLRHGFSFLELLREHIGKEDHVLFEMADQLVANGELAQLTRAYEEAEKGQDYEATHARCRSIAERLLAGP